MNILDNPAYVQILKQFEKSNIEEKLKEDKVYYNGHYLNYYDILIEIKPFPSSYHIKEEKWAEFQKTFVNGTMLEIKNLEKKHHEKVKKEIEKLKNEYDKNLEQVKLIFRKDIEEHFEKQLIFLKQTFGSDISDRIWKHVYSNDGFQTVFDFYAGNMEMLFGWRP